MGTLAKIAAVVLLALLVILGCSSPKTPQQQEADAIYIYTGEPVEPLFKAYIAQKQHWIRVDSSLVTVRWRNGTEVYLDYAGRITGAKKLPAYVRLDVPAHPPTPLAVIARRFGILLGGK